MPEPHDSGIHIRSVYALSCFGLLERLEGLGADFPRR
jgi:hypothetical protein